MTNIYIDSDLKAVKGKGGYGYVMDYEVNGEVKGTIEGFEEWEDTRNRIFLKASIAALKRMAKPDEIHIYIPCDYVAGAIQNGLLELWNLHAWIKGDGNEVKNRDLWEQLEALNKQWKPIWHAGPHKCSEWIKAEIERRRQDGTLRNRTHPDRTGQTGNDGASPYHF